MYKREKGQVADAFTVTKEGVTIESIKLHLAGEEPKASLVNTKGSIEYKFEDPSDPSFDKQILTLATFEINSDRDAVTFAYQSSPKSYLPHRNRLALSVVELQLSTSQRCYLALVDRPAVASSRAQSTSDKLREPHTWQVKADGETLKYYAASGLFLRRISLSCDAKNTLHLNCLTESDVVMTVEEDAEFQRLYNSMAKVKEKAPKLITGDVSTAMLTLLRQKDAAHFLLTCSSLKDYYAMLEQVCDKLDSDVSEVSRTIEATNQVQDVSKIRFDIDKMAEAEHFNSLNTGLKKLEGDMKMLKAPDGDDKTKFETDRTEALLGLKSAINILPDVHAAKLNLDATFERFKKTTITHYTIVRKITLPDGKELLVDAFIGDAKAKDK